MGEHREQFGKTENKNVFTDANVKIICLMCSMSDLFSVLCKGLLVVSVIVCVFRFVESSEGVRGALDE